MVVDPMSGHKMHSLSSKVAVFLMNSSGQCGYQYLPTNICDKVTTIINNNKMNNKYRTISHNKHNVSIDTIIYEMIFGSVALNSCAKNSSKIHGLSHDLLITSFIFQIDFSNGKIVHKKYGLAIIWNIDENDDMLRQLILKESLIIDSLISELRNDLINSRLKAPKDIHKCVSKFMKLVNDYLSVCRLTSNITDDQFIDELIDLINKYDTKATNFFVSTILTSILMFKYKSHKMKLILWSNDVNKISLISQLLIVINQFLKSKTKTISYTSPQTKSIKFCHNFSAIKRSCCVTPITKSIISERKSRDESLGYESLTESGSTTTSTICDYTGFAYKSLDASTPLEQSLEQTVEGLDNDIVVDLNDKVIETIEEQRSDQLNKSRNYFREYRNLRFTDNDSFNYCHDDDIDIISSANSDTCLTFGDNSVDINSSFTKSFKDEDYETDTITDVEEICESCLVSGFGAISMPELIPDYSVGDNDISLSQLPIITDTFLSQMSLQGIISSKTMRSYEDMLSECLKKCSQDLNDNTVIVCDCDLWRINYIENSWTSSAIMSPIIGQLCENISDLYSLRMNSSFIIKFIDNKINELILKSIVLKSLVESNCFVDNQRKQNFLHLFDRESKQSFLSLISCNYFSDFSSNDCLKLGFDVRDIPVIIALNKNLLINYNYYNLKQNYDRNEALFVETIL
ncbi:uncharacterized protein LOC128961615 [Oppia nitens]|uniref:uncharacterized protein LOC128961615 n=1 Tax=Oppia nitens TaxID=1686743 RepID=UPI0023DBB9CF|nr:uncharacterized protein LOC128961615 [Oppia nitens]